MRFITSHLIKSMVKSKTLRRVSHGLIFMTLFIALSEFLARNMLDDAVTMPNLLANHHATVLADDQTSLSTPPVKPWALAPQHLVYFFAPWCTVCALSQPSLEAFSQLKPQTQVIMVALDWETTQAVTEFKIIHQFDQPILLGSQALKQLWKIDAYPSYYFVDNQGNILSKDRGIVTLPGLLTRSL